MREENKTTTTIGNKGKRQLDKKENRTKVNSLDQLSVKQLLKKEKYSQEHVVVYY